jgi:hypothetical protein
MLIHQLSKEGGGCREITRLDQVLRPLQFGGDGIARNLGAGIFWLDHR